jgi:MYXO-CTERM domain-containing protein
MSARTARRARTVPGLAASAALGALVSIGTIAAISLVARDAHAGCGPTFCPSYTTCRVLPATKVNPTNAQLSAIFDQIAPGPSKYGSLGWNYTLNLNDGHGIPHPATKTPARYPCSLLKAISVHESVNWHQFCVPTGPTCTGVSQTIISFDCGYGLMQVTSGMRAGDTSSYDANLVASDPAYNVSVGSQILGAKWAATPSVGDNRLDVIEDWYFSVWAYNGLAFSNNPNNPKFDAARKPFRDPGGLSAGSYPYQEIIWGLVRTPYGQLEGTGPAYTGYPLGYPDRAQICASCGSPTAAISDPATIHWSDCPNPTTPPPATGPQLEIVATSSGGTDRFADGGSKSIPDFTEGDTYTVDLLLKDVGDQGLPSPDLGVSIESPYVEALGYVIESDVGHPGTFTTNDADTRPDNPSHTAPGAQPVFHMNALSAGETKRVHLTMRAAQYSIGAADHPDVRVWVQDVAGIYSKADFGAAPTNPSGQKFNGGDLKAYAQADVYSKTRWSFDGNLLEGWGPGNAADVAVSAAPAADGALIVTCKGGDPQAIGPDTSFDAATFSSLHVRAKTTLPGPTRVYFTTKDGTAFDESRAFDVQVPPDGVAHDLVVDLAKVSGWQGTITRLRVDPTPSGTGEFAIEDLRLLGAGGGDTGPGGGDAAAPGVSDLTSGDGGGGCGCRTGGTRSAPVATLAVVAASTLLALFVARRRRSRR